MTHWHEKNLAKIGLRLAGLALLVSGCAGGALLRTLVHQNLKQDASAIELLLAALTFASASAGAALTFVGAGLWKPVRLSARWASSGSIPVQRELEAGLSGLGGVSQDKAQQGK
jgi:hypothetical protein